MTIFTELTDKDCTNERYMHNKYIHSDIACTATGYCASTNG